MSLTIKFSDLDVFDPRPSSVFEVSIPILELGSGVFEKAPPITAAGRNLFATNAASTFVMSGFSIALGTGLYEPEGDETALQTEVVRISAADASIVATDQIRISATLGNGAANGAKIGEVGIYYGSTLVAILSKPSTPMFAKIANVDIPLKFTVDISVVETASIPDLFPLYKGALAASGGARLVGRGASTVDAALTLIEQRADAIEAMDPVLNAANVGLSSRPAFIEQHISGFFGRGMLTAETINIATEQALVGSFAMGAATLTATDATNFVVGGCCTVEHENPVDPTKKLYRTYFIDSKSGNNVGIRPRLRYACAAGRIERTWFNRAHPGKFYMRELAQRIASLTELDGAMPNGDRVLFTNVASNPNTLEDTLISVGGTTINYYPEDNLGGGGTVATPVRFVFGRGAYVENITAVGHGIDTQFFDARGLASTSVRVAFIADTSSSTTQYSIQVLDESNVERGKYVIPGGADHKVLRVYPVVADLRGAKKFKVRIACEVYDAPAGYFVVNQIDEFGAPPLAGKVISNPAAKIVCLGDSWVQGDLGNTPEREPLTTQLALELPYATVINAGFGGNKVTDLLARFDTDVAAHAPNYVVINTGTNEAYSPLSGTFNPTAIDDFLNAYRKLLNKIAAIGARPIVLGVPALAQSDADVPGFAEWLLNDRVKAYARYVYEAQSTKPFVSTGSNANGDWTKFDDGTLICRRSIDVTTAAANTLAGSTWTFPVPFAAVPKVTATPSTFSTNQLISTGANGATQSTADICLVSGSAAVTLALDCMAIGRWR